MAEYLSPEDFEIAQQNGISEERAKARFYRLGWIKQRAITEPVYQPKHMWAKYKDVSVVSQNAFYQRIQKGMTPEAAALTPKTPNGGRMGQKPKITQELVELAEKNGIKRTTFEYRMYQYRWSPEEAATIPIGKRRGRRKKL
jgi:hypothetical protein